MKSFKCRHCGSRNRVKVLPSETRMKSNVDVFLASEMLEIAYEAKEPIHIVILACDGDYAEAIKIAAKNKNVRISVIATPSMRDWRKNALSVRLKELRKELSGQYQLNSIANIKDYIIIFAVISSIRKNPSDFSIIYHLFSLSCLLVWQIYCIFLKIFVY